MMSQHLCDINCDLGEGMGNDTELMGFIDSCNIACGGHFGTLKTVQETIKLAQKHRVKIGAHPSYPDPENFGRCLMPMRDEELQHTLIEQLQLFKQACSLQASTAHHVKLHGALYNAAAKDLSIAKVVLSAIASVFKDVIIYAPYDSVLAQLAQQQFVVKHEAFIDRRYLNDLSLVPRHHPQAVIDNPQQAWQQLSLLIEQGKVITLEGEVKTLKAETFCLHGDATNALSIIEYIRKCL